LYATRRLLSSGSGFARKDPNLVPAVSVLLRALLRKTTVDFLLAAC
jgi:hypothetical protein